MSGLSGFFKIFMAPKDFFSFVACSHNIEDDLDKLQMQFSVVTAPRASRQICLGVVHGGCKGHAVSAALAWAAH